MAKIISQHFCFLSNNKLGTEKSMMKFLLEGKKNRQMEGNDKHEDAGSLLHNITSGSQCSY